MWNITKMPLQDGFETTLAQGWNGVDTTIYVQNTPSFTFPSGVTTFLVVDPWLTSMQVVECTAYDSVLKTFTVTATTTKKWNWVNYAPVSHAAGAIVRISDNFEFWEEIKDVIATKADTDLSNVSEYVDTTARDAALGGDWAATKNYRMIKAWSAYYNYNLSIWQWQVVSTGTAPIFATTTDAWILEACDATDMASGTVTWWSGAKVAVTTDFTKKGATSAVDENKVPVLWPNGKIDNSVLDIPPTRSFFVDSYYAGESIAAWKVVFLEDNTTFASSTWVQNIWDTTPNRRIAVPIFWNWINFTNLKLSLRKFLSPWVDLWVRIETDNAWNPSGTPVTNGTATVTSASLTTSLVDTTITFPWNVNLTIWQRFWIVLFAGTYWSETINATNYFWIWYNWLVHTSTRQLLAWNGTSWGVSYQPSVTDDDGTTLTTWLWVTQSEWYRLQANKNIRLTTITKSAWCTATRAVVRNDAWTILTTQSFSGNTAVLSSPQSFSQWAFFRVEADSSGSSYTRTDASPSFPINKTNVNYNTGSSNWANVVYAVNIDSVVTEEENRFIPYVSSTWILDNLLSLADSTYSYKSNIFGISDNTVVVWEAPNITIEGVNSNQSWLTTGTAYFLTTAGNISTASSNNWYVVGDSISATQISFRKVPYNASIISTLNATQTGAGTGTSSTFIADKNYFATFFVSNGVDVNAVIQTSFNWSTWTTIGQVTTPSGVPARQSLSVIIVKGFYYRTQISQSWGVSVATINMIWLTAI